jgi:Zn-dependent M32 family carboxypeptidase
MQCSETNDDYEAQILALQRENIETHEKLKDAENKLIELSHRMVEVEEENLIIGDLKAQIDDLDAEVNDKNKVRIFEKI